MNLISIEQAEVVIGRLGAKHCDREAPPKKKMNNIG